MRLYTNAALRLASSRRRLLFAIDPFYFFHLTKVLSYSDVNITLFVLIKLPNRQRFNRSSISPLMNMADGEQLDPTAGGTENTSNQSAPAQTVAAGKGKEKAPPPTDVSMDEDDDESEEEESGAEGAVRLLNLCAHSM